MKRILIPLIIAGALLTGLAPAQEPAPTTAETVATKQKHLTSDKSLLDLYREGGPIMHFIALCSVAVVALGGYCGYMIRKGKVMPSSLIGTLNQYMAQRQVSEAFQYCQQNPGPLTNALASALVKANFERDMFNKTAMENAVADRVFHEETKFMVVVNYLNTFAVLAPMIGLLGTVSGMISSFGALTAGKAEASDLAGGIGEALVATGGGLLLAIPAMFLYFFFRGQAQALMAEVHHTISMMLDLFTGEVTPASLDAPTGYTGKVPPTA
jgi:biopolymer transport protein ExbB